MMYSIYVTSDIRYDSFVALASKNVPVPLLQRDGSADVWKYCDCYIAIYAGVSKDGSLIEASISLIHEAPMEKDIH